MTTEEKLNELYTLLEGAGFPEFVKTAIEDVIAKGQYVDSFVNSLYINVRSEVELLESHRGIVYAEK